MIGSRNIIVNNYAGRTGAGVNQYCFNFITANGIKPIITESVEKPHFSQSKDWTQKELNEIFHLFRIPPWGRNLISPAYSDTQTTYMILGHNYTSLFTEKVKWENVGEFSILVALNFACVRVHCRIK